MQRKLAFCVGNWSADSTIFSWTYAKQYFLRKVRDEQGNEVLSELDRLYIVHVNAGKPKERWDVGGPILPRLSTALANYPHTIIELEGREKANAILDFAAKEEIDVLILGSREHKGAMTKMVPGVGALGSTSDSVKARCRCPCLIIRPSSARNEKMRIRSMVNLGQLMEGQPLGASLPQSMKANVLAATTGPEPRKVCIAFEHAEPGNNMSAWAAKHCLYPDDDIHLVHITNRSPLEKMQKSASFQKAMLKPRAAPEPPHVDENCEEVGTEELQGFEVPRRTRLKGDAKSELCEYLDDQHIDLLIVGFSSTNRIRKAFAGGSLSSHMLHHAPCPVLVLPMKSMAWEEPDTLSNLPELRPSISGGVDTQLSPTNPTEGSSPTGLVSLGPRVSMSRSLSHQLSQSRDQMRKAVEAPASPSSKGTSEAAQNLGFSATRPSAEGAAGGRVLSSPRESAGLDRILGSPTAEAPTSPFQAPTHQLPHASDSIDPQEPHARNTSASEDLVPKAELTAAQQQLADREAQIAALQVEVRQLKFQVAALKGGSTPGRVMLPAN